MEITLQQKKKSQVANSGGLTNIRAACDWGKNTHTHTHMHPYIIKIYQSAKDMTFVVYEPSNLRVEPAAATASLSTPLICKYGLGASCRWSTSIRI